ncbi:hypothetical protein QWY93_00355 [Echinicola jeungdonensis]|uniref:Uncharacterized protein n=1 Tax=Echinicola jeungdonensis TaxID=709343 RepID=A0ABV5J0K3_9BACT|nr:hypothetical protein [Echinicola jeungdonensis]MDN3667792.1 hypothetical protein [Echinicola jeungdonensis]
MQVKTNSFGHFEIPENLLKAHYYEQIPMDFYERVSSQVTPIVENSEKQSPLLITANLPKVLDWLHDQDQPSVLENHVCDIPLLLYDHELSTEKILFHYDGTPPSARIIKNFITLFLPLIRESQATIISPCFIPKSKQAEEQELIQLITNSTKETSFIKFNFTKIGDFWSYATKNKCTLLVTTKNYQAELAKVLFLFYKGERWYDQLSFYLAK